LDQALNSSPTLITIQLSGITAGLISHVLPLAFMVPIEIEDILAGKQPAELTADRLIWREEIPIRWQSIRG